MLAWSGRSPDLIVLDVLLWDYVKNVVYQETFQTLRHCGIASQVTAAVTRSVLKNRWKELD